MSDFVLVRHDNCHIGPISRAFAEKRDLDVVDGTAAGADGRPVKTTRGNGRPIKPRATVAKKAATKKTAATPKKRAAAKRPAAKKAAAEKASKQAVTPTEGAADNTLTTPKE